MIVNSTSNLWNFDETGLPDVFVPPKVVGIKGESTYQITSAKKGQNTIVLACFNAVSSYCPLLVLFKGKRMHADWAVGSPFGTVIRMTENG